MTSSVASTVGSGRRNSGLSRLFVLTLAIALFGMSYAGRAAVETTLLRGELDRRDWTVVDCRSNERVRVFFPSIEADKFMRLERELNLTEHESVLVQFEVAPIPSISSGPRSVGVMRIVSVERGRC
jgi:hypothetical protein